ncbi:MAG: hypothetical protein IJ187_06715 [Neisseriaceae bacterium]|nr:hypothetical protein [Neisseriaceae bacterium]MBQ9725663.1 hypothetical protein [Neisseriaceae bacterium]MBR1818799.1 hypothetical protein [Neisseriaceae bacterium]
MLNLSGSLKIKKSDNDTTHCPSWVTLSIKDHRKTGRYGYSSRRSST